MDGVSAGKVPEYVHNLLGCPMLHFAGSESFADSPIALFEKLGDAGFLARCLPDATIQSASPDRAEWTIKPKLSFLAGILETTATVVERTPTSQLKYKLETKGIGSGSTVEAVLNFEQDGAGTKVNWKGDIVAVTGLLKLAPKGLMQSTAEKVIADVWAAIRTKLAGPTVQ